MRDGDGDVRVTAPRSGAPHVLFYSLVFAPDGVSTAHIMSDLAEDLHSSGMSVSVVTTHPHQMLDAVAASRQSLRARWGPLLAASVYHGIPVLHTWMPKRAKARGWRAIGWLSFHVIGLFAALFASPRADVIIVPSPLLSAGVVAWLITVLRGGSFIYNVQELYPELAIRLGFIRNPALIAMLRLFERFVYKHAIAVTVIGPSMKRELLASGVPEGKVRLIPNFVDLSAIQNAARANPFASEHGLEGRFVVSYAGNLGRAQGLERLLDAAALMTEDPSVLFLLVGDGVVRESLVQAAASRSLANVRFVPHQPFARVPEIYGASDVCVIPILGAIAAEAVPSKVYRIMAAERPILALTTRAGDLGALVSEVGAGIVVDPVTPAAIVAGILELRRDPTRSLQMGQRGREYVAKNHSRARISVAYRELTTSAARPGKPGGAG